MSQPATRGHYTGGECKQATQTHPFILLLNGKGQWAYHALLLVEAEDYTVLKEEILAHCGLSPTRAASEFHQWSYRLGQDPRTQKDSLLQIICRWHQPKQLTSTEIIEWIALNCFL